MAQNYRLDYIELPSSEGTGSRRFFEQAFGWTFVTYSSEYEGISDAGIDTGIDSSADRVAAPLPVVRCFDLEAAEQGVRAAGGVITRPAFEFPGGRRFHCREPGGTELAVYISAETG